jgi:hypothetical protein
MCDGGVIEVQAASKPSIQHCSRCLIKKGPSYTHLLNLTSSVDNAVAPLRHLQLSTFELV